MARLVLRAYVIAVFEPGATNQELLATRNEVRQKLAAAGFTIDEEEVLRDQLVAKANGELLICDLGVARVKGGL